MAEKAPRLKIEAIEMDRERDEAKFIVTVSDIQASQYMSHQIGDKISESIAERYVAENYQALIQKVDQKVLMDMVLTKAILELTSKLNGRY